jgi:hypothetical protein
MRTNRVFTAPYRPFVAERDGPRGSTAIDCPITTPHQSPACSSSGLAPVAFAFGNETGNALVSVLAFKLK